MEQERTKQVSTTISTVKRQGQSTAKDYISFLITREMITRSFLVAMVTIVVDSHKCLPQDTV